MKKCFCRVYMLILTVFIAVLMRSNCVYASDSGDKNEAETIETAKITDISYDPYFDELVVKTDKEATIWVADVKKADGSSLQKKSFKSYKTRREEDGYYCSILLWDKDDFKISENKDAYFYVSITEPATDKKDYTPNYVIKGCPYKLSKIEFDYVAASKTHAYESGISSFVLKGSGGSTEYSKNKNYSEFLSGLSKLAFEIIDIWDQKEFSEQKDEYCPGDNAYDKDYYEYMVDTANSSLPAEIIKTDSDMWYYGIVKLCGRYTYDPAVSGNDIRTDEYMLTNPDNWTFSYADTEERRLYIYDCTITSDDGIPWDLCYCVPYHSDMIVTNLSNRHRLYCAGLPEEKPDLNGKRFIYADADPESGRTAGFYETESDGDELVMPLNALSDYGVDIYNPTENIATPEGLVVSFEETIPEKLTARDLGFDSFDFRYNNAGLAALKRGDYFTVRNYPGFGFSNRDLKGIVDEMASDINEGDGNLKYVIVFRYLGDDDTNGKSAVRSGQKVFVKVKSPAKSVKVKVDVKTDSVVLKSGLDFSTDGYTWYTILPFNKDGTAKSSIISTEDYISVKKVTENPSAFTSEKIKNVSVVTLCDIYGLQGEIYVRKSAKQGAPASAAGMVDISYGETAPILEPEEENSSYIAVSDDKDNIMLPALGDSYSEESYEYIIIDEKDFKAEMAAPGTIEASSMKWNKYKITGQKLTVGKSKAKYKLKTDDKAGDHVLNEGSYILVRVKSSKFVEKSGKETFTYYVVANDYFVANVSKATVDDKERYVLNSESTVIRFLIDYYGTGEYTEEHRFQVVIPIGSKLKKRKFPENNLKMMDNLLGQRISIAGWSTEPGSETPNVDENTVFSDKEVKLYAVLKSIGETYTVTFDLNYDDAPTDAIAPVQTNAYGKITLPSAPERSGYTFAGWFTNPQCDGDEVTNDLGYGGNVTLYVKWVKK